MRRRTYLSRVGGAGVALGLPAVAGCLGGGTSTVSMTPSFAFDPEALTVDAGSTVTWVNDSDVGHTVTAYADALPADAAYFASGGFQSESAARADVSGGIVPPGETYEHRFAVAGRHEYFCVPHEGSGMTGTVDVR